MTTQSYGAITSFDMTHTLQYRLDNGEVFSYRWLCSQPKEAHRAVGADAVDPDLSLNWKHAAVLNWAINRMVQNRIPELDLRATTTLGEILAAMSGVQPCG